MPSYNYECSNCKLSFIVMKTMKNIDVKEYCPKCNSLSNRLVSTPQFILKGKGFYNNDYKNNGK